MTLIDILQTISNFFMLVTLPIYILFLITLRIFRHDETLNSAFFKLMFSIGIADVGMIIVIMLGNTLAESGWTPEVYIFIGSLSARLSNVGLFGFGYAQNFGVFFVAINRYTAYMRPMKHNKVVEWFFSVRG
uniref:G-protein coupled receptors family 1 profile domain-containing protein n=1 Tax=Plectus sambesii TaxID=2011161 RepID=A0A914UP20_9BILA